MLIVLVLARKRGEQIILGNGENKIVLEVVEIGHGKVRIGIIAPRKVPIFRKELYDQIEFEKQQQDSIKLEGENKS